MINICHFLVITEETFSPRPIVCLYWERICSLSVKLTGFFWCDMFLTLSMILIKCSRLTVEKISYCILICILNVTCPLTSGYLLFVWEESYDKTHRNLVSSSNQQSLSGKTWRLQIGVMWEDLYYSLFPGCNAGFWFHFMYSLQW